MKWRKAPLFVGVTVYSLLFAYRLADVLMSVTASQMASIVKMAIHGVWLLICLAWYHELYVKGSR